MARNYKHIYSLKAINSVQRAKHSYYKETLALKRALEYFYHYVAYSPVIVATDCRALTFWNTTKAIPADVEGFMSYIAQFNITFVHWPGEKIPTSDAMSRDERFDDMNRHVYHPKFMKKEGGGSNASDHGR